MNDAELIEYLGGPAKVAEILKLKAPGGRFRVQNWKKRGIPARVKIDFPKLFLSPRKQAKAA